jgi:thymidylate synthase (FAD)
MTSVKLVAVTKGSRELLNDLNLPEISGQDLISFIARVSNPSNQKNFNTASGLLKYCLKHGHVSIFEHAHLTMEINTTLDIATQILRHRSFTFQQFSQRYADVSLIQTEIPMPELRRQDTKNRQNSVADLPADLVEGFQNRIAEHFKQAKQLYDDMVQAGVAKECARKVLPQNTATRLYMTGNIRSWIFYINLRDGHGTQKEHMDVAKLCREVFNHEFPAVAEALLEDE